MNITLGITTIPFSFWTPAHGTVFNTIFSLDTETTLIDDNHKWITPAYVLGAACDGTTGYFITRDNIAAFLKAHQGLPMAFHSAAFDLDVLQVVVGKQLDLYAAVDAGEVWDTMLLHQLNCLGTEGHVAWGKGQSTLETCTQRYLGVELPKDIKDSAGDPIRTSYSKWLNKAPETIEQVYLEYLAKDALATILVYEKVQSELAEMLANSQEAFNYQSPEWLQEQVTRWGPQTHHTQLKGAIVLRAITANGIHVDVDGVGSLRADLEAERDALREELRGYGYLPGAKGVQKAMQNILEKLAKDHPDVTLPRTETGRISGRREDLEELSHQGDGDGFINAYLAHQTADKMLSTYVGKMGRGILHPSFRTILASGRTASFGEINAQNLPRDGEIRTCFVARPGHVLVWADYHALELATLAQTVLSLLGSPSKMAELINAGVDLHRHIAAQLTGKQPDDVTDGERRQAKAVNFARPAGMGVPRLIKHAKSAYREIFTEERAAEFFACYDEEFTEITEYRNISLDAGKELARLLELTPDEYNEAIGRIPGYRTDDSDRGWLGGMCLKVLGEPEPQTAKGRPYTEEEVDYYWGKLLENIELFHPEIHTDIRARQPSLDLRNKVRNWVTRCPVFTSTGRLRANATYCQQRNTPFQGLAADGAKLALWTLWRRGKRIFNFVHDEIILEVREDADLAAEVAELCEIMVASMMEVVPDVQIRVEAACCKTWNKKAGLRIKDGKVIPWVEPTPAALPMAA